jgi:hypothetical protein
MAESAPYEIASVAINFLCLKPCRQVVDIRLNRRPNMPNFESPEA